MDAISEYIDLGQRRIPRGRTFSGGLGGCLCPIIWWIAGTVRHGAGGVAKLSRIMAYPANRHVGFHARTRRIPPTLVVRRRPGGHPKSMYSKT